MRPPVRASATIAAYRDCWRWRYPRSTAGGRGQYNAAANEGILMADTIDRYRMPAGMGAAPGHVAVVAAQPRNVAGLSRAGRGRADAGRGCVGRRRNRAHQRARRRASCGRCKSASRLPLRRAQIRFHVIPTNDAWCRDHGAIFAFDARTSWLRSISASTRGAANTAPYDADDAAARRMADALGVRTVRIERVLEGGSIEVNGAGTVLTTRAVSAEPEPQSAADVAPTSKRCSRVISACRRCSGSAMASSATIPTAISTI